MFDILMTFDNRGSLACNKVNIMCKKFVCKDERLTCNTITYHVLGM